MTEAKPLATYIFTPSLSDVLLDNIPLSRYWGAKNLYRKILQYKTIIKRINEILFDEVKNKGKLNKVITIFKGF